MPDEILEMIKVQFKLYGFLVDQVLPILNRNACVSAGLLCYQGLAKKRGAELATTALNHFKTEMVKGVDKGSILSPEPVVSFGQHIVSSKNVDSGHRSTSFPGSLSCPPEREGRRERPWERG